MINENKPFEFQGQSLEEMSTAVSTTMKHQPVPSVDMVLSQIREPILSQTESETYTEVSLPQQQQQRDEKRAQLIEAFKHKHAFFDLGKGDALKAIGNFRRLISRE